MKKEIKPKEKGSTHLKMEECPLKVFFFFFFLLMQNMVLIGFTAEYSHVLAVNEAIPTDFLTQVLTSSYKEFPGITLGYAKWRKGYPYRNSHCDTVQR